MKCAAASVEPSPCSSDCVKDYIDVFTSLDSNASPEGHICGSYSKYTFITYSTQYLIHYHTDDKNTGSDAPYVKGFSAEFEATGMPRFNVQKSLNRVWWKK